MTCYQLSWLLYLLDLLPLLIQSCQLLLYPFRPSQSPRNCQALLVQMNGSGYSSSMQIWARYSSKRAYAV
jgi:hypothetical protein